MITSFITFLYLTIYDILELYIGVIFQIQIQLFVSDLYSMGGQFFFSALKEGEEIKFATEDDNERHMWVQAMYRATGQAHKPVPPKQGNTLPKSQGERYF